MCEQAIVILKQLVSRLGTLSRLQM